MEEKERIKISNMHCSNCSMTIEKHFNQQDGIKVNVILSENEGIFVYDSDKWNSRQIEKQLKSIGYPKAKEDSDKKSFIQLVLCIILAFPFLIHMILMIFNLHFPSYFHYIEFVLATLIELLAGYPFFKGMIRDFKNKRLGMDVLVTLGTLTAYIYSIILLILKSEQMLYFETCAMLLTIILIGKYIEKKAKKKTTSSLQSLMALQEKKAKVLVEQQIIEKDIHQINLGDIIIVSTGEKIPLDGVVLEGVGIINESMISGESIPVNKNIEDQVLAGTILVNGNLKIKVEKTLDQTYLSSLIHKVEDIQSLKPKLQKIADKIASFFVPAVILISLICFIVSFIITKDFSYSLIKAITVLMVSCPCSLGLATPLSILVGSSRAISLSIIYNNTEIFEKASKIDAICFDKTGTLSEGKFQVVDVDLKNDEALNVIYTLESISNHPIAMVLVDYAKNHNAHLLPLSAKEIIGKGIVAEDYFIFKENQNVYLKKKNEIIAKITIKDKLKDDAISTIDHLMHHKISVYMFTGDNKDIALQMANELHIPVEHVFYEIKPEDKLSLIESLQKKGKNVCFVGDGINDALALSKANLSISMGSGSDIAMNSSDITLSNNKLSNIAKAINLSKKVYKNIIENFIWAFSYNIIAIPLAIAGILNPMIAGICMAFSSISVILNALRIKVIKI